MKSYVRVGLVAAIVAASLGAAPAAFAAYQDNQCDYLEVCAFKNINYGGGLSDMPINNGDFRKYSYGSGGSAHDSVSSGFQDGEAAQYWINVGYTGASFILADAQYESFWSTDMPNATSSTYNFNDKIDSSTHYVPIA